MSTPNLQITELTATQNNKYATLNDAFENFDGAITALLTVAMADANYILTGGEGGEALAHLAVRFTGTLTADRDITIPNNQKVYLIQNNTTGGFSLNVKTAAGAGVLVSNDDSFNCVYSDGTDVVPIVFLEGLARLRDVAISGAVSGQELTYNSALAKWENITPPVDQLPFRGSHFLNVLEGDGVLTTAYNFAETAHATAEIAASATEPALHQISSASTTNSYNYLGEYSNNRFTRGSLGRWKSYIKLDQTTGNAWLGVANDIGTPGLNSDDPKLPSIMFRGLHTDTNWQAYTGDGTNSTISDTGIAIDTNGHEFEIAVTASFVDFYIDGQRVVRISTTLPATSAGMFDFAQIDTRAVTGTKSLNVAYMFWQNKN